MFLTPGACSPQPIPTPYSREPLHEVLSSPGGLVQQNSLVSFIAGTSGEFVLLTQTMQGPGELTADGSLFTVSLAVNITHSIIINVDGTDVQTVNIPFQNGIFASVHYSAALGSGSHTVELRYFTQSTGVGSDSLSNMNLKTQVC